jgi:hypothetical protein
MRIKTINDIFHAVSSDTIDEFLRDFDISLRAAIEKKEALINEKLDWHEMDWTPDGKPEIHIELEPLDESVLEYLNKIHETFLKMKRL